MPQSLAVKRFGFLPLAMGTQPNSLDHGAVVFPPRTPFARRPQGFLRGGAIAAVNCRPYRSEGAPGSASVATRLGVTELTRMLWGAS